MNLVPTTASGLRSPRGVQTLPQVIMAGCQIGPDRPALEKLSKQLDDIEREGGSTPLTEALSGLMLLVDAKNIQAEFGLTEDEVALMQEEGLL